MNIVWNADGGRLMRKGSGVREVVHEDVTRVVIETPALGGTVQPGFMRLEFETDVLVEVKEGTAYIQK